MRITRLRAGSYERTIDINYKLLQYSDVQILLRDSNKFNN